MFHIINLKWTYLKVFLIYYVVQNAIEYQVFCCLCFGLQSALGIFKIFWNHPYTSLEQRIMNQQITLTVSD